MEMFGWLAFILVMCYASYPGKVKKLEAKVKKLERVLKGDTVMSKILSELVNQKCKLVTDVGLTLVSSREIECTILDIDDEWIKMTYQTKKGETKVNIVRIETIERVDLLQN